MRITRRSLLVAVILVVIAWCAGFAVAPVTAAVGASLSHRPPVPVALLIYIFFGAHVLALVALILAAVSGLVALIRDPGARTFRGVGLTFVALLLLPILAFFVWRGVLDHY